MVEIALSLCPVATLEGELSEGVVIGIDRLYSKPRLRVNMYCLTEVVTHVLQ